jgi:hypothetical protein
MPRRFLPLLLLCCLLCRSAAAHLNLLLTDGQNLAALSQTAPALYTSIHQGVLDGAAMWGITNDIDVRITIDILPGLGSLAAAAPSSGNVSYADVAAIMGLPTVAPFRTSPSNLTVSNTEVALTSLQMKALDTFDTRLRLNQSDGEILFSTQNQWDFDQSDGVIGFPFEAVAAHEIGHVLGFVSAADAFVPNDAPGVRVATLLDYYRFDEQGSRTLAPTGVNPYFSLDNGRTNLGYFSRGLGVGGPQASHFDMPAGFAVMDSAFVANMPMYVTSADQAAARAMGYTVQANVGAPEPPSLCFVIVVLIVVVLWARRMDR